jgi:uncharacterized protein involved in exopolysaccharide biosynthesis
MRSERDNVLTSLLRDVGSPQPNVRDLVAAFWRRRWYIAAFAIAGGVAGAGIARLTPPRYEAATTIRVAERAGLQTAIRTFQVILESNGLSEDVVRQFKLDQAPMSLTAATFIRNHLTIEPVRDTDLLRAHVALPEPQLTADVANALATRALEMWNGMNARANLGATSQEVDARQKELEAAVAAHEEAQERLLMFKSQAQLDVLRRNAADMLDARRRLNALTVTLQAEKGRLASIQNELSKQPKTMTVPRQVSASEALLLLTQRQAVTTGSNGSLANNLTRSEIVNPVYGGLQGQAATLRSTVAALEHQVRELESQMKPRAIREDVRRLADLRLSLEAERGRLASIEHELASQPKTVSVPRQVGTSEAFLLSLSDGPKGITETDAMLKELTHAEVVNQVYAQLEIQAATLRTNVAALEAEQEGLAAQLKTDSPSEHFTTVYERESEIARLEREVGAAANLVSATSTRYDQARESANGYRPQPEIVDRASVPDISLSRSTMAMTVAGVMVGLLFTIAFVLGAALMAPVIRSFRAELT